MKKMVNPSHEHVSLRRRVETVNRVVEAQSEEEALERSYDNADLDERIESIKEKIWDLQQELIDISK